LKEGDLRNQKIPRRHGKKEPGGNDLIKHHKRDFPGVPVLKTLHFHCRGHVCDSWLGNSDPRCHTAKKRKTKSPF
jgi:hypothetical protein